MAESGGVGGWLDAHCPARRGGRCTAACRGQVVVRVPSLPHCLWLTTRCPLPPPPSSPLPSESSSSAFAPSCGGYHSPSDPGTPHPYPAGHSSLHDELTRHNRPVNRPTDLPH